MKTIFSKYIPFKGFFALNFFGILIVRKEYESWFEENASSIVKSFIKKTYNHESIHAEQMKELFFIGFYVFYSIAWIIRLLTPPLKTAYRDISFEQEAYSFEKDSNYLLYRKPYSWINYIFTTYRK